MAYGTSKYVGRAAAVNQVLAASATVTTTGTGTVPDLVLGEYSGILLQLEVTAAATAVGDLLDVFVQTTIDNATWLDMVHFTQVLGNGGAKRYIAKVLGNAAALTEYETGTALGAAAQRAIFGDQYRVRWVVTSSSAPSFTFSVKANFFS